MFDGRPICTPSSPRGGEERWVSIGELDSEVIAVGSGRMLKDGSRRPLQIKAGDTIIFTNWAGEEYKEKQSKDNILLMREEDVLAVIDK